MNAVERLKRDHQILRAKLNVLETALTLGPESWYVLREVCFTLSRQLQDHMRREEELIARCRQTMSPHVLAEIALEHQDEPAHLRTINRLFITQVDYSLERIKPVLTEAIQGLRRHMAEEEAELFPILERELRDQETVTTQEAAMPTQHVDETMTVNRIVHDYPATQRTFRRLFINVPYEGCTCLDEVAWRHGMNTGELVKALERVITARGGAADERETADCEV